MNDIEKLNQRWLEAEKKIAHANKEKQEAEVTLEMLSAAYKDLGINPPRYIYKDVKLNADPTFVPVEETAEATVPVFDDTPTTEPSLDHGKSR